MSVNVCDSLTLLDIFKSSFEVHCRGLDLLSLLAACVTAAMLAGIIVQLARSAGCA